MPEYRHCPACRTALPSGEKAPACCPACGARLAEGARRVPEPAESKPPVPRGQGEDPPPPEVSRKPKRKRRQRIQEMEGIDHGGLLRAAGAAVLLLGVSLGFAALVRVAVGSGSGEPGGP